MLVAAAAQQWKVKPDACRAEQGVRHRPGGKKASLRQPRRGRREAPGAGEGRRSRSPKDFKLIGKPTRRIDSAEKVDAQDGLRHGHEAARPAHGARGAPAGVRRQGGLDQRGEGEGRAGRDARGADLQRRRGGRARASGRRRRAATRSRSSGTCGAGAALSTEDAARSSTGELAGSPAPWRGRRPTRAAIKAAAKTVVRRVRGPVPRPRADGAAQLHRGVARRRGEIWCGSQFQTVDQARRREGAGPRAGEGEAQHAARGRRLRPARQPGLRLRDRGVRDRHATRRCR